MGFLDKVKNTVAKVGETSEPEVKLEEEGLDSKQLARVDDVLEVLQIPATFEIPAEIFLPDDLRDVNFDFEVPRGFDQGQVTSFVQQTRVTVKYLTDLLKKRNQDVAKLATQIDKLQVDNNNIRFDMEISQGISVMPTEDNPDLENELLEAKLHIRKLEDQIRAAGNSGPQGLSDGEREAYGAIQDELSLANKRISKLEDENFQLKNRVAYFEDMEEDEIAGVNTPAPAELTEEELRELGIHPEQSAGHDPLPNRRTETASLPLPSIADLKIENSYSKTSLGFGEYEVDDEDEGYVDYLK